VTYIDTNALLGLLVPDRSDDHRAAVERVRELGDIIVCESVLAETVWVLEDAYGLGRADAAGLIRDALDTEGLRAWDRPLADAALQTMGRSPTLGIVDSLLAVRARQGDAVLTFDRGLARQIEQE
jgi:predicted nucleic acid-binding protein